jgi:ADP-heptose:LPS heptosyltransferase
MGLKTHDEKSIVFFANGIGDHVLALPTLRAISACKQGKIILLHSTSAPLFIFEDVPIERRLAVQMHRTQSGREFEFDHLIDELRNAQVFCSLVPWPSPSIDMLLNLTNPKHSIGFSGSFSSPLHYELSIHASRSMFAVATAIEKGLDFQQFLGKPNIRSSNTRLERDIEARIAGKKLLCIHNETIEIKRIPSNVLHEAVKMFLDSKQEFVCICLDYGDDVEFLKGTHDRIVPVSGIPLEMAAKFLERADVFLGVDSCMLHFADLFRVPSVGIFGPTDPSHFGFLLARNHTLTYRESLLKVKRDEIVHALKDLVDIVA